MQMTYQFNDGGRKAAGYKGIAGDCAARALAIAAEIPYPEAIREINELKYAERTYPFSDAHKGVYWTTLRRYLIRQGWQWHHYPKTSDSLPDGRLIVPSRNHVYAAIDGIVHDLFPAKYRPRGYYKQSRQ